MSNGPIYRLDVRFVGGASLALGEFRIYERALDMIENLFAFMVAEHLAARTGLTFDKVINSAYTVSVTRTDNRKQYNHTGLHCVFSVTKVHNGNVAEVTV